MKKSPQSQQKINTLPSLSRRSTAFIIDFIIFSVLLLLITRIKGYSISVNYSHGVWIYTFYHGWLFLLLFPCYFLLQEFFFNKTLGKKFCKLELKSLSGKTINRRQLVLRNIFKSGELFLIGLASILSSNKNLSIGDRLAKTVVVRVSGKGKDQNLTDYRKAKVRISLLRKIFAALLLVLTFVIVVTTAINLPKIYDSSKAARAHFMALRETVETKNIAVFYQGCSQEFQEEISPAEFAEFLQSWEQNSQLLQELGDPAKLNFYSWRLFDDRVILYSEAESGRVFSMRLVKEDDQWKVESGSFSIFSK